METFSNRRGRRTIRPSTYDHRERFRERGARLEILYQEKIKNRKAI
jgi:hypothetical protein